MATLGAAVGMLAGLVVLAIALWELPRFRREVLGNYQGLIFVFGAALVLGGWAGHSIFTALFHR
jgi:hypothetical protein